MYDEATRSLIIYGGIFGYSKVLSDCFRICIDEVIPSDKNFTAVPKEVKRNLPYDYFPQGRAWHTATKVDRSIYYIGGINESRKHFDEVGRR